MSKPLSLDKRYASASKIAALANGIGASTGFRVLGTNCASRLPTIGRRNRLLRWFGFSPERFATSAPSRPAANSDTIRALLFVRTSKVAFWHTVLGVTRATRVSDGEGMIALRRPAEERLRRDGIGSAQARRVCPSVLSHLSKD